MAVRLFAAEPQLFVADVAGGCDFYVQRFGFHVVFQQGTPPYYGQVARDGAALNLRCVTAPGIDQALRDREELLSASITLATCAELELLADVYKAAGVDFFQALAEKPRGAINFVVRDLDGNLLLFAAPA